MMLTKPQSHKKSYKKKPIKKKNLIVKTKPVSTVWLDEAEEFKVNSNNFFYNAETNTHINNLDDIKSATQMLKAIEGNLTQIQIGYFQYTATTIESSNNNSKQSFLLTAHQWALREDSSKNIPLEFFELALISPINITKLYFSNFQSLETYWDKWIELNFSYIIESNYVMQLNPLIFENVITKGFCPLCGLPIQEKKGKFGKFWGCSGWPECKATWNEKFIPNQEVRKYLKDKKKNKYFDIEEGKKKILQVENKKIFKQMANLEL